MTDGFGLMPKADQILDGAQIAALARDLTADGQSAEPLPEDVCSAEVAAMLIRWLDDHWTLPAVQTVTQGPGWRADWRQILNGRIHVTAPPARVTVKAPQVAWRGPADTDASMMRDAAWNLRNGYDVGGSNVRDAIARLLDEVADELAAGPSRYEGRPSHSGSVPGRNRAGVR